VIRVAIADDHPVMLEGLDRLLQTEAGFDVVGQAATGADAVKLVKRLQPDVLMLDVDMPQGSGMDVLRELAKTQTDCRVILIGGELTRQQSLEAVRLGARGLVTRDTNTSLIFKSIRTVMTGQYWIGRDAISDLIQCLLPGQPSQPTETEPETEPRFRLTQRELQIVAAVVAGYANREIADRLSLSENTVKHHLSSVFAKLGVANRLELALFAINHQLIAEGDPFSQGSRAFMSD
jgi:DNA-binding NarL/FixJ family response regulator